MHGQIDGSLRAAGQRVVDACPRARRPLRFVRSVYAVAHLSGVAALARARHPAAVDPFGVYRVDPAAIERTADRFDELPKYRTAGRIVGGSWDRGDDRFTEQTIFRSFRAHFEAGVPWAETAYFEEVLESIEAGEEWWGCRSREDLERRWRRLEDLYEAIERDGVLSQGELIEGDAGVRIGKRRTSDWGRRIEDEVAVHVGRDGEFLFCDGRNRLAIAKLLDLDTVPVRILVRHADWQAIRNAVATGRADPGEYADHPDVRGLR